MKHGAWEKKIREACMSVGTYKPAFDDVIRTLAEILEKRDEILKLCKNAPPVVQHTNSHGNTNTTKNPLLMYLLDYNNQALAYWRDLGLTAKGLKAIDESALKAKKKNPLAGLLDGISNDSKGL